MAKAFVTNEPGELSDHLKTTNVDAIPFRQFLDDLRAQVPFSEAMIVTSLPRGGLQIAQPPEVSETLIRAYAREFHALDRLTWHSIATQSAVRGRQAWGNADRFEQSQFFRDFLKVAGFEYAAAAFLSAPVLEGYSGALHVYRTSELGPFKDDELEALRRFAAELDEAVARSREGRRSSCPSWSSRQLPSQMFVFDQKLNLVIPAHGMDSDSERLRQRMAEYAQFRLGHLNGKAVESDRVSLPDAQGDLRHFRVVVHRTYPALGEGPFVFFCVQPSCCDWSALRPADFQADAEVARLVPAMKFMRENFHRGPTLGEIAKVVHLSPFHFHRRFTELFGITPKHFMLDCQIEQAKSQLLAREKDLSEIAAECGFAHQSHFTSRFKQTTGLTPTRWRRMATESRKVSQQN